MNKGKEMLVDIIEIKRKEVGAIKKQISRISDEKMTYLNNNQFDKFDVLQERAEQLSHQRWLLLEDIEELKEVLLNI